MEAPCFVILYLAAQLAVTDAQGNLYDFTVESKEIAFSSTDDAYVGFGNLPKIPMPFCKTRNADIIYVSTNGYISFNSGNTEYGAGTYGTSINAAESRVAPFYRDLYLGNWGSISSSVFVRGNTTTNNVERATADVMKYLNVNTFEIAWMFVATWSEISANGIDDRAQTLTFQVAVITNGYRTFTRFAYRHILIAKDFTGNAQVGYRLHDNDVSCQYTLNADLTIYNNFKFPLHEMIGNTGERGVWIFELTARENAAIQRMDDMRVEVVPLGSTTVDIGGKVSLFCRIWNNAIDFEVTWYKDNQLVRNVNTYLYIIVADIQHGGYYHCEMSNNGQTKKANYAINVVVNYPCGPHICPSSTPNCINNGRSYTCGCNDGFKLNETSATCEDDGITIQCHELYAKGIWDKKVFQGSSYGLRLADAGCHTTESHSNQTHIWITAKFADCTTPHHETDGVITQEVTAVLDVSVIYMGVIQRNKTYQYRIQCHFNRKFGISSSNYFNPTNPVTLSSNLSSVQTNFSLSMNIYTTNSFLEVADSPHEVSSSQPIFIGITEGHNNSRFKFIVDQCYATPTASKSGTKYTIFDKKCPADPTFETLQISPNKFYFTIKAFNFIQIHQSVYIHCNVYICAENATGDDCQQTCSRLRRRSINGKQPLEEITVMSQQIYFKKVRTCDDLSCPTMSRCINSYPAECSCEDGYAFNFKRNQCSKENIVEISGVHIEATFLKTYSNPLSADFLRLEGLVKKELTPLFEKSGEIEGMTVTNARSGSVVLTMLLLYARKVSPEEAKNIFLSTIVVNNTEKQNFATNSLLRKFKKDMAIEVTFLSSHDQVPRLQGNQTIIIVAVTIVVAIIAVAVATAIKCSRRRQAVKSNIGIDNNGVDSVAEEKM